MKNIITLQSDGGCSHNPGNKYGSFAVFHQIEDRPKKELVKTLRIPFGYGTNNEAEFDALEAALKWVSDHLDVGGFLPKDFSIQIHTDSTVVAFRINGSNSAQKTEPEKRMFNCAAKCLKYLIRFKAYSIDYISRDKNVALFGH